MAENTFEAYIELIAVFEKLEPKLFKAAIKTVKE